MWLQQDNKAATVYRYVCKMFQQTETVKRETETVKQFVARSYLLPS